MTTQAVPIDYDANDGSNAERRARVWPAVLFVAAYWAARVTLGTMEMALFRRFLGMLFSTGILLILFLAWWSVDRRGRKGERLSGVLAFFVLGIIAGFLTFKSIGPMALILTAMPWVFTAWALWIVLGRNLPIPTRKRGLLLVLALAWGTFALFRGEGLDGQGNMLMTFRWSKTAEERYLAQQHGTGKSMATTAPVEATTADWPGFRGPQRDGIVRNLTIDTNWQNTPPRLLWKQPIGPGWSSMCVVGGRLYTQEQRGDVEAIVCRDANTGAELWAHLEGARFEEAMAGAGPRATPTFADGRLYALTARGLLLCVDAATGEKRWSRDLLAERAVGEASKSDFPIWGFCASPLVNRGHVIVFAGGDPKGVIAYDAQTGAPAWTSPAGKVSYGSVQQAMVAGEEQLLVWSDKGIVGIDPDTGAVRWDRAVGAPTGMPRSLQPHPIDGGVLVASEGDSGATRLDVKRDGNALQSAVKWTTTTYRPSFTDFVIKGDYLYGVDGGQMTCVDLRDGKRKWRKGRFGAGQVVLLDDQSLLLVLCEDGQVALVAAKPDGLQELARFEAINGKTWNHPAVARGKLYVRNGEEIACFELKK